MNGVRPTFDVQLLLSKTPSDACIQRLARWVRYDEWGMSVPAATTRHLRWVFDALDAEGVRAQLIGIDDEGETRWHGPHGTVVAGVLVADWSHPGTNPPEDHTGQLPAPCLGPIRPDRPVHVAERPKGHLTDVGYTQIVSSALAQFIGRPPQSTDAQVFYKDQPVPGWTRLPALDYRSVLDPMSFAEPGTCRRCGSPYRASLGTWIALPSPDLPDKLAFDAHAFGDGDVEHPIVVTVAFARFLSKTFRKGLVVAPVFANDSEAADIVRMVLERTTSAPTAS